MGDGLFIKTGIICILSALHLRAGEQFLQAHLAGHMSSLSCHGGCGKHKAPNPKQGLEVSCCPIGCPSPRAQGSTPELVCIKDLVGISSSGSA
jgi:hypothetical protein